MNKSLIVTLIAIFTLTGICVSQADSLRVIKLKDGSTLKGNVISLSNGVYTFETENLGEIDINESDILSISSPSAVSSSQNASEESGKADNANLERQVQQIQGSIMTDPEIMMDLQTVVQDEEVQKLLSDPQLLNDVKSYDEDTIKQNQNVQDLMGNPKIQQLMEKIKGKLSDDE